MARKRYTSEQVIAKLREAEVWLAGRRREDAAALTSDIIRLAEQYGRYG